MKWGERIVEGYPILYRDTLLEMLNGDEWFRRPDGDHPTKK